MNYYYFHLGAAQKHKEDGNITWLLRQGSLFQFGANGIKFLTCTMFQPMVHIQSVSVCFSPCKIINKSYQENLRKLKDAVALGYSYPLGLLASSFLKPMEILSGILPSQSTAYTDPDHAEFKSLWIMQHQDILHAEVEFIQKATSWSRWQFSFGEESNGIFNTI